MLTQEIKNKYVERALMHQKADDFRKGFYWNGGKGCCVGCLAHANDDAHEILAEDTNVPKWIYHVADTLFEGLPLEDAKKWPVRFVSALPVGLSEEGFERQVKAPFLIAVLESASSSTKDALKTFNHKEFPNVKTALDNSIKATDDLIKLWQRDDIGSDEFKKAANAARAAARAAAQAAWAAAAWAAWAAAWAAARAAWAAAGAAAWAAWAAAGAAGSAAEAAGAAAWAAGAAGSAGATAEAAKYQIFADKLIELMENANANV